MVNTPDRWAEWATSVTVLGAPEANNVLCPGTPADGPCCGLWLRHDGDCLSFVPGWYLLPPLLHPADLPWFGGGDPWPCFTCGRLFDSYTIGPAHGSVARAQLLTVYPCGCSHRLPTAS
jgi:hypothetical protein